jgi:hypothetical protein
MRQLQTRPVFLALLVIISFFGMREVTRARVLDVAAMPPIAADVSESNVSACDPLEGNQIQPSNGLHCQFDSHAIPYEIMQAFAPDTRAACFPTEICPTGSPVNVSTKPPNLDAHN